MTFSLFPGSSKVKWSGSRSRSRGHSGYGPSDTSAPAYTTPPPRTRYPGDSTVQWDRPSSRARNLSYGPYDPALPYPRSRSNSQAYQTTTYAPSQASSLSSRAASFTRGHARDTDRYERPSRYHAYDLDHDRPPFPGYLSRGYGALSPSRYDSVSSTSSSRDYDAARYGSYSRSRDDRYTSRAPSPVYEIPTTRRRVHSRRDMFGSMEDAVLPVPGPERYQLYQEVAPRAPSQSSRYRTYMPEGYEPRRRRSSDVEYGTTDYRYGRHESEGWTYD